jgi:hypothetical protein
MTRMEIVKQLADSATRPLIEFRSPHAEEHAPQDRVAEAVSSDLFVWFEDTSARAAEGRRGIAGLPESLLPWPQDGKTHMQVVERRYAPEHMHLLSAVRLRCKERFGDRIAALYTAALSVGTVAWIGTGQQYEQAWNEMYHR